MTQLLIIGTNEIFADLHPCLALEGFCVDHEMPGLDAIRRMLVAEPDVVVVCLTNTEQDWQFCRRLLTFLDKPLLLLLPGRDERERIAALNLGADDCMGKPFHKEELVARIRALLRRSAPSRSSRSYFVDEGLVVDLTRREVWLDDEPVSLTPTEFRFLTCFTTYEGEVLSHDRLAMYVWGALEKCTRDSIKLYIYQLRRKLEPDPANPQRFITRRGEGYLFQRLGDRAPAFYEA